MSPFTIGMTEAQNTWSTVRWLHHSSRITNRLTPLAGWCKKKTHLWSASKQRLSKQWAPTQESVVTSFLFSYLTATATLQGMPVKWIPSKWNIMVSWLVSSIGKVLKISSQLSNLWWMPNSVSKGFDTAMRTGSSRRFKRYPTTYMWVLSWLPFTVED